MSSSFLFLNFVVLLLHIQFISCSPAQCVRNTFYFDKDSICNTKCLQWITNSVEMRQVQDCSDHPERTPTICQSILETYNNTCQELVSKIIADDPVIDATCKAITSVEPCCQESKCFWIAEDHGIPEFPVRPFEIIYLLNFKCWKGNNRYCESLTTPFGLTLSSQADCPVSKDINYQPLCTDCLPTVAQVFSPILSYVTNVVCIKDQGDYCYNGSQALPTLPEELRKRCNHSCPPDWILSSRLLHNDDEIFVNTLTATSQAICLEENGQYCFERLMKIGNNKNCDTCSPTCCNKCIGYCIPGCLKYVNPDNYDIVCVNPLSCDEVKSILNSTNGCCIDAYKKAISSPFDSDLDDLRTLGSYDAFEYTLNKCGIKDGSLPPCTTYVTKYPKTMTIKGNCSAIQNFDDIKKAVTIDLNNNVLCYGCAVDLAITCTPSPSSNANGDQIYISFSILGMNAERAQQYSKEYDSKSPIIPVVTMFYLESIGADIRN